MINIISFWTFNIPESYLPFNKTYMNSWYWMNNLHIQKMFVIYIKKNGIRKYKLPFITSDMTFSHKKRCTLLTESFYWTGYENVTVSRKCWTRTTYYMENQMEIRSTLFRKERICNNNIINIKFLKWYIKILRFVGYFLQKNVCIFI